jgi:hypothetical protein
MWQVKVFKTKAAFDKWVSRNNHRMQWQEIFVNNAYGVEFRRLRQL